MRPDKQGRKHRPRLFMRILAFIISVSMLLSNLAFGAVSTVNAAENAAVETYVGQKATASDAERTVEKATGSNASPSDALFDEDGFLKDGEVEPEIKEYMITLDGNGGKVYDSDQYTMTLSENDLFWALPEATWEDHYFTGWYEDPECTEGIERGDTPSEDMILYAGWTQENVTVTYVSSSVLLTDDGENYSNEIVKEYPKGSNLDYTPGAEDGYWAYWYYDEAFTDGNEFVLGNKIEEDLTIYLKAVKYYTVSLDANGGIFEGYADNHLIPFEVSSENAIGWLPTPKYDDEHGFLGWSLTQYTEADPENAELIDPNTYYPSEDVTFYAVWSADLVTVTYVSSSAKISEDGQNYSNEIVKRFAKGSNLDYTPVVENGYWGYWYYDEAFTDGNEFVWGNIVEGDLTIYLKAVRYYTVNLDANGGVFKGYGGVTEIAHTFEAGQQIGTPVSPDHDGDFALLGWSRNKYGPDPEDPELIESDYIPREEEEGVTLYAVWTSDLVTVTYVSKDLKITDDWVNYSNEIVKKLSKGSKIEYYPGAEETEHFYGWFYDEEYGKRSNWDDVVENDAVIYLLFTDPCTLTLDAHGGQFSDGTVEQVTSYYIGDGVDIASLWQPSWRAIQFKGWFYDEECTEPVEETFVLTGDTTLYAGWKTENLITVTLVSKEGLLHDPSDESQQLSSVEIQASAGTRFYDLNPYSYITNNEQYRTFWAADENGTERFDTTLPIEQDTTIYLKAVRRHKVTLDFNGGSAAAGMGDETMILDDKEYTLDETLDEGEVYDLKDMINEFWVGYDFYVGDFVLYRDGYAFDQWYMDGAPLQNKVRIDKDITLTAQWTKGNTITLDLNGGDEEAFEFPKSFQIKDGDRLPVIPDTEKEGKQNSGWQLPDGRILTDTSIYTSYEDVTLKAVWDDKAESTVTVYLHNTDPSREMHYQGSVVETAEIHIPAGGTLTSSDEFHNVSGEYRDLALSADSVQAISIYYYTFTEDTHLYTLYDNDREMYFEDARTEIELGHSGVYTVSVFGSTEGTYEWEYLLKDGTEWRSLKADFASSIESERIREMSEDWLEYYLYLKPDDVKFDGMQLRGKFTETEGTVRTSEAVKLTLTVTAQISKQPENVTASSGKDAVFKIGVNGSTSGYQWQYRNSENDSWKNAAEDSAKTAELKLPASTDGTYKTGTQVRCLVTDSLGNVLPSEAAELTVTEAEKQDTPKEDEKQDNPGEEENKPAPDGQDKEPEKDQKEDSGSKTPEEDSGKGSSGGSDSGSGSGSGSRSGGGSSSGGGSGSGRSSSASSASTGWKLDSNGWSYRKSDGSGARNEWQYLNGKWYAFNDSGYMETGWRLDPQDGHWYYLDPASGAMLTGWQLINGKYYYLNPAAPEQTWKQDEKGDWVWTGTATLPTGALWVSTTTPDESQVDQNGERR